MVERTPEPQMTPEQLAALREPVVLDVREDDEWRAGHIAGAVHIPMRQLRARVDELDAEQPLVAVCRSGQRSGQVTRALNDHGFDATNLDGGLKAWVLAGLPLVAEDGSPGKVI